MNGNNEIQAVDITRTREDYLAFSKHALQGFRNLRVYYFVALTVTILLLVQAIEVLARKRYLPDAWTTTMAIYIVVAFMLLLVLRRIFTHNTKQEYLNDNQAFLRKKRLTIDEKGLRETSDVGEAYVIWQGVDRIKRTDTLMLVYVDRMSAFCIPIRNFSSPEQANQFYENMLAYWHKARQLAVPVNTQ